MKLDELIRLISDKTGNIINQSALAESLGITRQTISNVFCYNGEFFVKRLSKNLDEIIIKSDNPEYRIRNISGKAVENLILIGKIVATIKQLT